MDTARVSLSAVWAVAAILTPVAAVTVAGLGAVDLAYHLRLGEAILSQHGIARVDTFTFTAGGLPWLDQQWGAQVILETIYRLGGWLALAAARSALAAATLGLVLLACRARGASLRSSAWLTFGSGIVVLSGMQLRPQLFGIVCFAATLWLLARRDRHPVGIWLLVPLVIAWANLHGSFFLAPLVVGLVWLEARARREPGSARLLWLAAATVIAPLANPFGFRVWTYVVDISTNPAIRESVVEWQPPSLGSYAGTAFFISVAVVGTLLITAAERPSWPRLLWFGVFFAIGLSSIRGAFWWGLAAPVGLADLPTAMRAERDREDPVNVLNLAVIAALVLGLFVTFARWLPYGSTAPPGTLLGDAPLGVTRALRSELGPGERVFNAQMWGSWLEYALPGHPVAVDSRIELFPQRVWDDYADVSAGREGWQSTLDRWGVRVLALDAVQQADLISSVRDDPGWTAEYHRGDAWVFVRSSSAPSGTP